jgi:hypothetical protein
MVYFKHHPGEGHKRFSMTTCPVPVSTPQAMQASASAKMAEKHLHGRQWELLFTRLLDLYDALRQATHPNRYHWRPLLSPHLSPLEAATEWGRIQNRHLADIYAAWRELVRTGHLADPTPEVRYFLNCRFQAALRQAESSFIVRDDIPESFIPFPLMPTDDVAEWLLTEWGNGHAFSFIFPSDPY